MQVTATFQDLINTRCWTLYLNWTNKKSKDKEYIAFKVISIVWTAVHFFSTCQAAWFELSMVNLYRNDLKGNKT